MSRGIRALEVAAVAGLAAFGSYLIIHDHGASGPTLLADRILYCSLIVAAAVLCLARAALVARERWAWLFIGLNLAAWALSEVYWAAFIGDNPNAPYPSLADGLDLLSYPLALIGVALLVRARVRRFRLGLWADAAIAALALAAFWAAFVLPDVIAAREGEAAADAVTVAYPIADLLLLSFLLAMLVAIGWRGERTWLMIAGSLAILPVADTIYSYQAATGSYAEGGVIDFLWPLSAVLLALTAWRLPRRPDAPVADGWRSIAAPVLLALAAATLLVYGYFGEVNLVAVSLAGAALLAAGARLTLTYRENERLFERAQTDSLTGLGNRSRLLVDLRDVFATANGILGRERTLAMLDLNGFKSYNDAFGHPAGDALLRRLAARLESSVGAGGEAYRIGGDEFCVLLEPSAARNALSRVKAALGESGEAFEVSAACGAVQLPTEAADAQAALQLADRRMYDDKSSSRTSARTQAMEVLTRTLREREPSLGGHVDRVAGYSLAVAGRMGIGGEELDVIGRAAELHDIGKVAVPDAVLSKPGPLDPDEWRFIADHTIVGERILRAAPALAPVAALVRSSHERWDGGGYPDGLAGDAIPLGSRVIFACDALDAMMSERPYAAAIPVEEALAELEASAGGQFDPRVVELLCDEIRARPEATRPRGSSVSNRR